MIEKEGEHMSGRIVRHVAITDIYHGPRPQDHGPRVAIPEDRAYVLCVRAFLRTVCVMASEISCRKKAHRQSLPVRKKRILTGDRHRHGTRHHAL